MNCLKNQVQPHLKLNGIICFMHNKTPEYLESLPDEEKLKMTAQAIEEKQDYRIKYLQEKKRIRERKMQQMQERKEKRKRANFGAKEGRRT